MFVICGAFNNNVKHNILSRLDYVLLMTSSSGTIICLRGPVSHNIIVNHWQTRSVNHNTIVTDVDSLQVQAVCSQK